MKQNKSIIIKALSIAAALLAWQLASFLFGIDFIFASPLQTLQRLFVIIGQDGFLLTISMSFLRITLGFVIAFALAIALAALAAAFGWVEHLLWPYMVVIKTVPVASFVVLAIIFMSSNALPVFTSAIIVLPIIYQNVLTGIKTTDKAMLEMARVFAVPKRKVFKYIRLPSVKPYLISGTETALGMGWKAGVAAEIIGIPAGSIGLKLFYAKQDIDSASLFAWTVVIVVLSVVCEKLFMFLLRSAFKISERS